MSVSLCNHGNEKDASSGRGVERTIPNIPPDCADNTRADGDAQTGERRQVVLGDDGPLDAQEAACDSQHVCNLA
ncbi:hypothetical protein JOB18_011572 [Solea senegalensis]|uniref:Uncharacterized protein n=1 Tax=Solea senegalensis TaxID=28829 RepID=A0AAV6RKH5_SOLSE|nr:hypothetical protein JOB18_011572 [Solea senegalensis]